MSTTATDRASLVRAVAEQHLRPTEGRCCRSCTT